MVISPGDTVRATVTYTGSNALKQGEQDFTLAVTDLTTKVTERASPGSKTASTDISCASPAEAGLEAHAGVFRMINWEEFGRSRLLPASGHLRGSIGEGTPSLDLGRVVHSRGLPGEIGLLFQQRGGIGRSRLH